MDVKSLIKNKFIIAIPVSLLFFGCLYKFNEFRNINNEENKEGDENNNKNKQPQDLKYYLKALIICYLLGIVFVILIKKGYNYYINGTNINNSIVEQITMQNKEHIQVNDKLHFNKEEAIIKRENELNNDIKDLNVDIDTSNLESIEIPTSQLKINKEPKQQLPKQQQSPMQPPSYPNDKSLETKKQILLEKKKKIISS